MKSGLDLFFDTIDIPIEHRSTIEYEVAPYISIVYELVTGKKYLYYIDNLTGEEIEEDLDTFEPQVVNQIPITQMMVDEFNILLSTITI